MALLDIKSWKRKRLILTPFVSIVFSVKWPSFPVSTPREGNGKRSQKRGVQFFCGVERGRACPEQGRRISRPPILDWHRTLRKMVGAQFTCQRICRPSNRGARHGTPLQRIAAHALFPWQRSPTVPRFHNFLCKQASFPRFPPIPWKRETKREFTRRTKEENLRHYYLNPSPYASFSKSIIPFSNVQINQLSIGIKTPIGVHVNPPRNSMIIT